jgi:hypothetical protein
VIQISSQRPRHAMSVGASLSDGRRSPTNGLPSEFRTSTEGDYETARNIDSN